MYCNKKISLVQMCPGTACRNLNYVYKISTAEKCIVQHRKALWRQGGRRGRDGASKASEKTNQKIVCYYRNVYYDVVHQQKKTFENETFEDAR